MSAPATTAAEPSPAEVHQRILERRRQVRRARRRRRLRVARVVLAALAAAAALYALERSPLVALDDVRVRGVERVDPAEVAAAARLPVGESTLRLDLDAAARRVERLPLVADARVRRLDPVTVEIAVTERTPALTVRSAQGAWLVDANGVVVAEGGLDTLPVLELTTGSPPRLGAHVDGDPRLGPAFTLWQGLSGPLREQVARYIAADGEVGVELLSGTRVRFGTVRRLEEKVRSLGVVLEDLGSVQVSEIDVRAPRAPAVMP